MAGNSGYLVLETVGVILVIWVVCTITSRNFKSLPMVKEGGTWIDIGPYKIIRHPMYSATFLITLALVLSHGAPFRSCMWAALLIDIVVNLVFEEQLLSNRYLEYATYRARTKRLVPFLF